MRRLDGPAHRPSLDAARLVLWAVAIGLGIYFWDSPLLRPLKLLVVMMHETGHALASWLVGGTVKRVTLAADESGACLSSLPAGLWRAVIVYSAGYLGSAVASGLLLLATFRWRLRRAVPAVLSAWLLAMAVFYAGDAFTLGFCIVTAAVLFATRWLPSGWVAALNVGVASFSGLYAVIDLRDDLWDGAVRARSDAQLLADLTWIPALVWAALWSLLAAAILVLAVRAALRAAPQ